MKKAKDSTGNILENQNHLLEIMNDYTTKVAELFQTDNAILDFNKALVDEYTNRSKAFFAEVVKPVAPEKFLEKLPETFNKAIAMQTEMYSKSFELYKEFWNKYSLDKQAEKLNKTAEIYQEALKAMTETATKNVKVVQDMMEKK